MIAANRLCKSYTLPDSSVIALNRVSLSVPRGGFAAVVGSSGSGKSTLLNVLGLLDRPDSGRYLLSGRDVSRLSDRELSSLRAQLIGFVFQNYNLVPRLSAVENVELGLVFRGISRSKRRRLACDALEAVGLADRLRHLPGEMSGGQQQRVAIARAIAGFPELILADEPTGNLDETSSAQIMEILEEQNRRGVTLLLITHSPEVAARASDIYRMTGGILAAETKNSQKGIQTYETGQNKLLP